MVLQVPKALHLFLENLFLCFALEDVLGKDLSQDVEHLLRCLVVKQRVERAVRVNARVLEPLGLVFWRVENKLAA